MRTSTSDHEAAQRRARDLKLRAAALGFEECRITGADAAPETRARLQGFLEAGHHGGMAWMAETAERRGAPAALWPEVKSIAMVAVNYAPAHDPLADLARREHGLIAAYALNRDYHDVIKGRLKTLAQGFQSAHGGAVKVFVDTAPLMEKPLAAAAGLGFQGKHTNLVSRRYGSWLLLGALASDLAITPDVAEAGGCGRCTACLAVCPTGAFPEPYKLDARRCISYLTIEHDGNIPREFRKAIGNRIYGCDDCLAVCPWNKFAQAARETKLRARAELLLPELGALLRLDEAGFRALFRGSPVKRIGYARFMRNVLIAAGNSGSPALIAPVTAHLDSDHAVVRAMAVWALRQLEAPEAFARRVATAGDADPEVMVEWQAEA